MKEYAKAITGAIVAGLTALGTAVADGSSITTGEWIATAIAFLAALTLVWAVPNSPPAP